MSNLTVPYLSLSPLLILKKCIFARKKIWTRAVEKRLPCPYPQFIDLPVFLWFQSSAISLFLHFTNQCLFSLSCKTSNKTFVNTQWVYFYRKRGLTNTGAVYCQLLLCNQATLPPFSPGYRLVIVIFSLSIYRKATRREHDITPSVSVMAANRGWQEPVSRWPPMPFGSAIVVSERLSVFWWCRLQPFF